MGVTESHKLNDFVTISEAATKLNVTRRTIDRYIRNGHLPARKLPNGYIRIPQTSIDTFLEGEPALAASDSSPADGGDAA